MGVEVNPCSEVGPEVVCLLAAPLGRPREPFAAATAVVSPSAISGALAIQTGQPSRVGTVWLRVVELTTGLGGLNCGLNTLGSEGVCRVNEGVRREAFDEGVRLTGRAVSAEGPNIPGSVPYRLPACGLF